MAEPDPLAALRWLERDREHGAAEIGARARSALARLAELDRPESQLADEARRAVLSLAEAHPSMAALVHLADETLRALDEAGPEALAELPRQPAPAERLARHAAPAIAEADTVATYSRSGTVLAAIEAALEQGLVRVRLSEARPGGEGVGLARRLAEAGADVELTYDARLFGMIGEADLVLVGADAITADAFVNKTGTRTLLDAAKRAGTRAWVLASTDKLWPPALPQQPRIDEQAGWQPAVPDAVEVDAPLFERVPLGLADCVVTEDGPQRPEELAQQAGRREIHPDVVAALTL